MIYLAIPLVGGLIGWFTNYLAIKLVFRPFEPTFVLGFTIHGVIPKRRAEIAESIGVMVENQLISTPEIFDVLLDEKRKEEIIFSIRHTIRSRFMNYLPGYIPHSLKELLIGYIDDIIKKESKGFIDDISSKYRDKISNEIFISKIIEKKINNLDMEALENLILGVSKKELKYIEYLGGFIGFLIGLVQSIIIYYIAP
jgi:uncharacterized membrane protein YheB (UPF0754 family)